MFRGNTAEKSYRDDYQIADVSKHRDADKPDTHDRFSGTLLDYFFASYISRVSMVSLISCCNHDEKISSWR